MKKFLLFFPILIVSIAISQNSFSQDKLKGVSPEYMDLSVKPSEDFYRYVNGTWLKNNPIPPEYSRWGAFSEITANNDKILNQFLKMLMQEQRRRAATHKKSATFILLLWIWKELKMTSSILSFRISLKSMS